MRSNRNNLLRFQPFPIFVAQWIAQNRVRRGSNILLSYVTGA